MAAKYVILSFLAVCLLLWLPKTAAQYIRRRRLIQKHGCKPPPGMQQMAGVFGLDLVLRSMRWLRESRQNASTQAQYVQYGPTYMSKVYNTTKIHTIDPRNLQAVFSTEFAKWGVQPLREFYFGPFIGRGILTTDGAFWEHSRALIRPTFSRTQLADLSTFDVHMERLMKLIPKDGGNINLKPLFSRLALDSSTEFLFGESTATLLPTTALDVEAFLDAYNYGQIGIGRRMQTMQWNFLTRDPRFWRSCTVARDFVGKYVDNALSTIENSSAPMEKLAGKRGLVYRIAEETQDRTDIVNQLLNIFLPAHDATAVALTNVFFSLARHPNVYAKLRDEVLAACGADGEITFEDLKSFAYLRCVLNESFRLHPAIAQMNRVALCDTVLPVGGGDDGRSPIFAPKGTVMLTSFYALHRQNHLFGEDADRFRPERWETLRPTAWSYLPFGGGPRLCVGQQLGLAESGYAVAKIVQRFQRIENADPVLEFVEEWKITTDSKNGAKVRLFT